MKSYRQPKRKYLIDIRIITGLNLTIDQKKIKKNCKLLDIDMSYSPSKISTRNNISILTVGSDYNNHIQFEVKHNLDINELNKVDEKIIPDNIKSIITRAYKLTQINSHEDIFY